MPGMTSVKAYLDSNNTRIFRVGEQVQIGIDERALLVATLLAYFVPLVLMLLAAGLSHMAFGSDGLSALAALFGLAIGAWFVRLHARRQQHSALFHPQVL